MTIGEKIQYERKRRGLSIRGLAAKCESTTFSAIAKIEKGLSNPNIHTVQDIAAALNVDVSVLTDNETRRDNKLGYFSFAMVRHDIKPEDIDRLSPEQLDLIMALIKQFIKK